MSKRNLIIAAVILIVLAVGAQLFSLRQRGGGDEQLAKPVLDPKLIGFFNEMTVEGPDGKVHLSKKGDQWTVAEENGFPVEMRKLVELTENLSTYKLSTLITKDSGRHEHFKLVYSNGNDISAGKTGTQLTLKQGGKEIYKMIIGKRREPASSEEDSAAQQADGVYIRIGESPAVYLIKENLQIDAKPVAWIKKSLFDLEKDDIKSVVFELPQSRFELKREKKEDKLIVASLAAGEKTTEYFADQLLSDLQEFPFQEVRLKNEISEQKLELKSVISISLFDGSLIKFQILSRTVIDPVKTDEKGKDKDKKKEIYYTALIRPATQPGDQKWNRLYELGDKWYFEMEDYYAKRWMNDRDHFVDKPKPAK